MGKTVAQLADKFEAARRHVPTNFLVACIMVDDVATNLCVAEYSAKRGTKAREKEHAKLTKLAARVHEMNAAFWLCSFGCSLAHGGRSRKERGL